MTNLSLRTKARVSAPFIVMQIAVTQLCCKVSLVDAQIQWGEYPPTAAPTQFIENPEAILSLIFKIFGICIGVYWGVVFLYLGWYLGIKEERDMKGSDYAMRHFSSILTCAGKGSNVPRVQQVTDTNIALTQPPPHGTVTFVSTEPPEATGFLSAVAGGTCVATAISVEAPVFRPPNVYPERADILITYDLGLKDIIAGDGTIYYTDGGSYRGGIYNKMRHGNGTMIYADGNIYVGKWDEDHRHGDGGLTTWDGQILYDGRWAHDRQQ